MTVKDRLTTYNVGFTGPNFAHLFGGITLRADAPKREIQVYDRIESVRHVSLRSELPENHTICIEQFVDLIGAQRNGRSGVLLVNECANVAYVEDDNEVVWAVYAYFSAESGDWRVEAESTDITFSWLYGYRVVSGRQTLEPLL
jgi:hypothetical protein